MKRQVTLQFLLLAVAWMILGMSLTLVLVHATPIHCYGMREAVNAPDEYPVYKMDCNSTLTVLYVD